jgi:hypothetical protein
MSTTPLRATVICDEHGEPVSDYTATYVARNRPTPKKRTGKTSEALVSAAVDRYLKKIGAINIRTNAGAWQDEAGYYIQGAKAGTSDKTCCIAGAFVAIETKSATGKLTEAQERYQARVTRLGGLYIVARSAGDVRSALVTRFGESVVKGWES